MLCNDVGVKASCMTLYVVCLWYSHQYKCGWYSCSHCLCVCGCFLVSSSAISGFVI